MYLEYTMARWSVNSRDAVRIWERPPHTRGAFGGWGQAARTTLPMLRRFSSGTVMVRGMSFAPARIDGMT